MNIGRLIFFIFILAYCLIMMPDMGLKAQSASSDVDIVFSKLDVNEFVSNNQVYSIFKDHSGYMWIGGRGGLYKYDSIGCKSIAGFENEVIWSIYEDSRQVLWLGTEAGLFKSDSSTGNFTGYTYNPNNPESISSNIIWDIYEDESGILWIGTDNGLNSLDRETGIFTRYANDNSSSNNCIVRAIYEDNDKILWIATNCGLTAFERKNATFTNYIYEPDNPGSISSNVIWYVYEDSHGVLWICTEDGLNTFDRETGIINRYVHDPDNPASLSDNQIWTVYEDSNGKLWIGTNNGLNTLDRETGIFTRYMYDPNNPESIKNNIIRTIYEDEQGILWFGTRMGVHYINPDLQCFKYYDSVNNIGVRCIYSDINIMALGTPTGILWFDYKKDVIQRNFSYSSMNKGIANGATNCIYVDDSGSIWFGTKYLGLIRIDAQTGQYENYSYEEDNPNSLPDNWISSLCYDAEQDLLWIGTVNGLCSFNYQENKFNRYYYDLNNQSSIASNIVNIIYKTKDGELLFGTDKGLDRLDKENGGFIHYTQDQVEKDFLNYEIICIYEDVNKVLWIGTNEGLVKYDSRNSGFYLYTEKDGLPGNLITGVLGDNYGNIWLMIDYSLVKLSVESKDIIVYGNDHGLRSSAFYSNSISTDKDGLIFIGTSNGLFSFDSNTIPVSTFKPPVLINGFSLINNESISFDKPIEEVKEIKLPYSNNSFIIDFVALDYTSQRDNKYAYILEGFDTDWQYCGPNESFARYTNVNSGEYQFKVRARNIDNILNEEWTSLKIIISPPFWKEWWFALSCVAVAIAIILLTIYQRIHKVEKYSIELESQVNARTQELIDKSDELKNELNRRVGYTRALIHELKTPLTSMINTSEVLKDVLEEKTKDKMIIDMANTILDGSHALNNRIDQLHDIARGELGMLKLDLRFSDIHQIIIDVTKYSAYMFNEKQQKFIIDIPDTLPLIPVDEQRISEVLLNLLNNASKFTQKGGLITLRVTNNTDNITIEIEDNGLGINPEIEKNLFQLYNTTSYLNRGLGIGLYLSKMIVELHGGIIWGHNNNKGRGSLFGFSLPLKPGDK